MGESMVFEEFESKLIGYLEKIDEYGDLEIKLESDMNINYEFYLENFENFIFNCLPNYKNSEYDWEFFMLAKYEKLDFRFLESYSPTVKSFIINLILLQNAPECSPIDVSFIQELVKIIKTFDEILEIVEIIKTNKFLCRNYTKLYEDRDLNEIMLREAVKDSELKNKEKMETQLKQCILDNQNLEFFKLEIKYDVAIKFIFKDQQSSRLINSSVLVEDFFKIALEKFDRTREFNFYFEQMNYNEIFINELLRYLYVGEVKFDKLTKEDIMNLWTFGDERMLVLKDICQRYLELDDNIINLELPELEITTVQNERVSSLYYYKINQYTGFYTIKIDDKIYYLYGGINFYGHIGIIYQYHSNDKIRKNVKSDISKYFKKYNINYNLEIIKKIYNLINN